MLMDWPNEEPWGAWSKLNECDVCLVLLTCHVLGFPPLPSVKLMVERLSNFLCGTDSFLSL